ncbi:Clg1p Ecym_1201 [Eremothecium cymbalariae DBVPG|uniref:Cyclin N-terminal domain-containing protein n=1 Tax=Eremothecium cymbalariae (strain CBS 270.75 / DBVPG 7215 / KCTC 17166 / NRRL Y-17582) TaxID=931890 RepID=G8JMY5_ERECY|nr:hypothetical protein Ecym_1201 [Eremothecium cymbalariae DBVPG\
MASFMYYPNYAGAAVAAAVQQQLLHQQHHQHQHQQQKQPVAGVTASTGVHHGLPPMLPYGYFHQPPQVLTSTHDLQPPISHYSQPASFMVPSANLQYIAPPPGIAPPMQAMAPVARHVQQCSQNRVQSHPQQPQKQYVNGGVSEVLDYDLEVMTSFVVQNSYLVFGNEELNPEILEIFSKGVLSVLNATRLPSTTIYFALDYLSKYLGKLPHGVESIGGDSVNVIYQNLMVAFVLANKFNDDKTFTNKSWSQATGMKCSVINTYEREWLAVFEWRLFEDGFENYEAYREAYYTFEMERKCPHQNQPLIMNNHLAVPSGLSTLVPPPAHPANCQTGNYYGSPFSQRGYHTPLHAKTAAYSSPFSDIRSESYSSYYQPCFTSPISNASPVSKSHNFGYYNSQHHSQTGSGSVVPNSFWNIPFDRVNDKYQPSSQPNKNLYCYSTAY